MGWLDSLRHGIAYALAWDHWGGNLTAAGVVAAIGAVPIRRKIRSHRADLKSHIDERHDEVMRHVKHIISSDPAIPPLDDD